MEQNQIPIIGIVGGVGSGKSAVARWLVEAGPGYLIDADRIGHAVLLRQDVQENLRSVFGESIFAGGTIDRRHLAELVFGDGPEYAAARSRLEQIVHPIIRQVIRDEIGRARLNPEVQFIILDAAILLETGWREECDLVAFVDVPRHERLRRVAESRGWSSEELDRREASQWSVDRKRLAADIVIDNSQSVDRAGRQLAAFIAERAGRGRQDGAARSQSTVTAAVT
ncbi:MAG: dephospho-CoA kinase [Planctomycetaceae bacterium]|nr:dephospho-CoA kinase [Planctomycetaceae bacterium]